MKEIAIGLLTILRIIGFFTLFYAIPYLIRLGWNHAENRTKLSCDVCFRDIKKINEFIKTNPASLSDSE